MYVNGRRARILLTQKVSPDVARLRVDPEYALETGPEGGHWRPVAMQQKVVVLQPVGKDIVGDYAPPALPYLG